MTVKAFEDERDRYASSAAELVALEAETVAAMAEGYDVIYQPTFFDGRWMGRADFLLRVETPSARWPWGYEAADAKLARRVRSEAILQLCEYSAHISSAAGNRSRVDAGDPRRRRASIHTASTSSPPTTQT